MTVCYSSAGPKLDRAVRRSPLLIASPVGDHRHRRLLESTVVGEAWYSAIRALRAWLWLIAVVVALAGGVLGFVLAYDAASTRWQILAGIGAGVVGALLYATNRPERFAASVAVFNERHTPLWADERVRVPRGDLLWPVPRVVTEALTVAARDAEFNRDAPSLDAYEVVGRFRKAARAKGRDGPRMNEKHPRDRPHVGHVPVTGEDEVDAALAEQREHVAGIQHLVSLAASAWDRHQVVVADEHAQASVSRETFLDPAVMLASYLAFVEVGLRRVNRDERQLALRQLQPQPRIARAEGVFEAQVADVTRVVIARNAYDPPAGDARQLFAGEGVLVGIAVVGEVARHDDQVGLGRVDLVDRSAQEPLPIAAPADVNVGDLRDEHRLSLGGQRRRRGLFGGRRSVEDDASALGGGLVRMPVAVTRELRL